MEKGNKSEEKSGKKLLHRCTAFTFGFMKMPEKVICFHISIGIESIRTGLNQNMQMIIHGNTLSCDYIHLVYGKSQVVPSFLSADSNPANSMFCTSPSC